MGHEGRVASQPHGTLDDVIALLPTPQASDPDFRSDASAARRSEVFGGEDVFTALARRTDAITSREPDGAALLPTPVTTQGGEGGPNRQGGPTLHRAIGALLPTPQARDGDNATVSAPTAQRRVVDGRQIDLEDAIALLPTPSTASTGLGGGETDRVKLRDLDPVLAPLLPTPTTVGEGMGGGPSDWAKLRELDPDLVTPREKLLPTPLGAAGDPRNSNVYSREGLIQNLNHALARLPGMPDLLDGCAVPGPADESEPEPDLLDQPAPVDDSEVDWGVYATAIATWVAVIGRPAPAPTVPGKTKGRRLSPRFVEWLMGLPDGHVTDVPGLSNPAALRMLGNGVVPPQAEVAIRILLGIDPMTARRPRSASRAGRTLVGQRDLFEETLA